MNIDFSILAFPFIMGILGVFAHTLKRSQVNGEGKDAFKAYINMHFTSIALTWIGFVVTFAGLYEMEELSMFTGFSAGYMADSLFSKIEKSGGPKTPIDQD